MILLTICGNHVPPEQVRCVFNHPVVMCCLIWAIVIFVMSILFYCYKNKKAKLKYKEAVKVCLHEKEMKELSDRLEASWFDKKNKLDELKESTDDGLKVQVKDLKTKVSELEGKLNAEKFNKDLLEKQLKMYSDVFEQLKVEVKPKV